MRHVFTGEAMLIEDLEADPRYATRNPYEQALTKAGFRSGLMVPIHGARRIVGVFDAEPGAARLRPGRARPWRGRSRTSSRPASSTSSAASASAGAARGWPRWTAIGRTLGGSLNVRDVFERLAEAVRPALDFDAWASA